MTFVAVHLIEIHVGPEVLTFSPSDFRENVKKVNTVYGDKPKSPIPNVLPSPRTITFRGLAKKNMAILHWNLSDQSVDFLPNFAGSDIDSDLKLHSISATAEMKDTVDGLALSNLLLAIFPFTLNVMSWMFAL